MLHPASLLQVVGKAPWDDTSSIPSSTSYHVMSCHVMSCVVCGDVVTAGGIVISNAEGMRSIQVIILLKKYCEVMEL